VTYLVEVPVTTAGGAPGLVQVEVEEIADGLVKVARPGQVVARASRALSEMLTGIRPIAQNFVDGLAGTDPAPDQVSVEFGLSLSAAADIVISSTSAQANFKVSLTWHGPGARDGAPGNAPTPVQAPASVLPAVEPAS